MIKEYTEFLSSKTNYWRKAKQYEYQDIDRIILALQNINHYTTRNIMTLRLLGLVENLGNDNLRLTEAGTKLLSSEDKQKIIDEQLLKMYLESSINTGLKIPVFPLQIVYQLFQELTHFTFDEYLLFVCWINEGSEVALVNKLILEYRDSPQDVVDEIHKILDKKRTELGTDDIRDNVGRLFNMFSLSSFITSDGARFDKVLSRNSSPETYEKLAKLLDGVDLLNYVEFDYKYNGLINFAAEHNEIAESLSSLTIEQRKLFSRDIKESQELPDLEQVRPVLISPSIVAPKISKVPNKLASNARRKIKPDYEARENRNRIVGLFAEKIVVKSEFDNLIAQNKIDLANRVEQVSVNDDSLGYDIVSFSPEGEEKHIEVKAINGYPSTFRFFISSNETMKARLDPNFYLYLVFDYKSEEPKIWQFPNIFKSEDPRIKIEPTKFAVTVSIVK